MCLDYSYPLGSVMSRVYFYYVLHDQSDSKVCFLRVLSERDAAIRQLLHNQPELAAQESSQFVAFRRCLGQFNWGLTGLL